MSLVLNTGVMKYRENYNQPWRPLVLKANMNWESLADTYDPDNGTYEIGQYVLEDSVMYRCIYSIDTPEAWTPAHWTEINIGDELFSLQDSIASEDTLIRNTLTQLETNVGKILPVITGTTNNSGYTINQGDYFEANGALYKATASIPMGNAWSTSKEDVSRTVINDILTGKSLTLTRTANELQTAEQFALNAASIKAGILFFVFDGSFNTGVTATNFVEIGTITGWRATNQVIQTIVGQTASSITRMTLLISLTGSIQVYIPVGTPAHERYRTAIAVPSLY